MRCAMNIKYYNNTFRAIKFTMYEACSQSLSRPHSFIQFSKSGIKVLNHIFITSKRETWKISYSQVLISHFYAMLMAWLFYIMQLFSLLLVHDDNLCCEEFLSWFCRWQERIFRWNLLEKIFLKFAEFNFRKF